MLSCLLGAACAGAPAVRSCWNLLTRSNVVHTAVEAIHGTGGHSVDAPLTPADRAYAALLLLFDPEQGKSPDPCASTPTRAASAPATDNRSGARDAALAQATDVGRNESLPSCCPHGARPAPHASTTLLGGALHRSHCGCSTQLLRRDRARHARRAPVATIAAFNPRPGARPHSPAAQRGGAVRRPCRAPHPPTGW